MNDPSPQPTAFRPAASAEANEANTLPSDDTRSRRHERLAGFFGGAVLLSTTALLPIIEVKIPPNKGD